MMTPVHCCKRWSSFLVAVGGLLAPLGCYNTPIDYDEYTRSPAPLRMPAPV
jgi:hypothetical protein